MRPYHRLHALLSLLLLGLLTSPVLAMDAWLENALAQPTPASVGNAPALILLHEEEQEWDERGNCIVTLRRAVRILSEGGRHEAIFSLSYNGKSDKVLSKTAWRLRAGTANEKRRSIEWVDVSGQGGLDLFNEYRFVQCNLYQETVPGDVFAVEVRTLRPALFSMVNYWFGGTLPRLKERLVVTVPAGFQIKEYTFGATPLERLQKGPRSWSWEVRDLPFIPDEALAPSGAKYGVRLRAEIIPAADSRNYKPRRFADWKSVNDWNRQLTEVACDRSPEITAKAQELCRDIPDELGRIRALARHVQQTRYVSVAEDLLNGSGYVPRKASKVLGLDYGDCKDKANLLMALLREVGIESYSVGINVYGRLLVDVDVPTMSQFNHAILAVKVGKDIDLPACVDIEGVGRLLFIDPTNSYTHVGDLPSYDQGQLVQVVHPQIDSLIRLPLIKPEHCLAVNRTASLEVTPEGQLLMQVQMEAVGQGASELRAGLHYADNDKKKENLLRELLSPQLKGANLLENSAKDDREAGKLLLTLRTRSTGFLQRPQKTMIMAKLNVLRTAALPVIPEKERRLPLLVTGACENDTVDLAMPQGTEVDQLPRPVSYKNPYGSLDLSFAVSDGKIVMRRKLVVEHALVQPEAFAAYKQFLSEVARADKASVLLKPAAAAAPSS